VTMNLSDTREKGLLFRGLAQARCGIYTHLSAAFREPPTDEMIEALTEASSLAETKQLFGESVAIALDQCASSLAGDDAERTARSEFMNLFKVPGGQYVTPYESVFLGTRRVGGNEVSGLLAGQSSVDVQKWYRLAALDISPEFKELPDHIAIEFGYLAHLCRKERGFAESDDEARLVRAWEMERDFVAAHIMPWIGPLRDKIRERSQHPYFAAIAELAVEFSRHDLVTLEDLLGPSEAHSVPHYDPLP
jgi:TorA maturation chaperone TorD